VTITAKSSATVIPINAAKKPLPVPRTFEKFKEAWQLQVAADNSLPAGSLRVALAISSHMNRSKNGLAWPGYNRLQGMLGIGRRTVIRNVQRLEKAGHLTVERRRIGSRNAPNQYRPKLLKDASKSRAQDDTTLVSQLWHHPSVTGDTTLVSSVTPEPLNEPLSEPLNEPLPDTGAVSTAPKDIQIKGVANEVRQITVASSDNPLSSSQRSRRGSEATGLFSEHWFLAGDPRNRNGGRRR
jgi:hypothetical protein